MYMAHGFGSLMNFGLLGLLGAAFQLLIVAGIVFLIVYLIRSLSRRHPGPPHYDAHHYGPHQDGNPDNSQTPGDGAERASSAIQILDERFAKGEITVEEYRTMKEELKK